MAWTKEKQITYNRKYYKKNKEALKAARRKYYRENPEKCIALSRKCNLSEAAKKRRLERQRLDRAMYPEKHKARRKVRTAIDNGTLSRGVCEVCGHDNVEAHHDDYSKPLEVRWLCRYHHRVIEGKTI